MGRVDHIASILLIFTAGIAPGRAQQCPSWSPTFDQIDDGDALQNLQNSRAQGWDNVFRANGAPLSQQIAQAEQIIQSLQAAITRDQQIWDQIGQPPKPSVSAQVCKGYQQTGIGAAMAAVCDEHAKKNALLGMQGMLDLMRCRAGVSPGVTSNSESTHTRTYKPGNSRPPPGTTTRTYTPGDNTPTARSTTTRSYTPGVPIPDSKPSASTYTPGVSSGDCVPGDGPAGGGCNGNDAIKPQGSTGTGAGSEGRNIPPNRGSVYPTASSRTGNGCSQPGDGPAGAGGTFNCPGGQPGPAALGTASNDSKGMLAVGGALKPPFVGMSSEKAAVVESNRSTCDATVHVTLLESRLRREGADLQFQVTTRPNPTSTGLPPGCFELEYTIEATQRTAKGDPGPPAGSTYRTKFSSTADVQNVELPIASNGSNGTDLVGWRVIGAFCHTAENCVPNLSSEKCAALQDYRQSVLPGQRLSLIKRYGILSIRKDTVERLRSDLIKDMAAAEYATSGLVSFLIDLQTYTDFILDVGKVLAPEGELRNLAVLVGPKPSLTSRDILKLIETAKDGVGAVKAVGEEFTAETASDLALSASAKLNPIVAVLKDIKDNGKKHEEQNTLIRTLDAQLDDLERKIEDYDQSMQQVLNKQDGLRQISDGIDMACNSASGANPNR